MLALVTGDAGSTVAQVAGVLGDLRYERGDEEEADVHAMRRMQRARLDARAMARAYRMLERESEDAPRFVNYLSTHPRTADRIAFLEREAASAAYAPEPLLAGREWPPPVTCPAGQ